MVGSPLLSMSCMPGAAGGVCVAVFVGCNWGGAHNCHSPCQSSKSTTASESTPYLKSATCCRLLVLVLISYHSRKGPPSVRLQNRIFCAYASFCAFLPIDSVSLALSFALSFSLSLVRPVSLTLWLHLAFLILLLSPIRKGTTTLAARRSTLLFPTPSLSRCI